MARTPRCWSLEGARALLPDVRKRTETAVAEVQALLEQREIGKGGASSAEQLDAQIGQLTADWARAIPLLEQVVAESPDRRTAAEALGGLKVREGAAAMERGDTPAAIGAFERARQLQGTAFSNDLDLGVLYLAANLLGALHEGDYSIRGTGAKPGSGAAYRLLDEDFSIEPYAFALPSGEQEYRVAVNRVLARLFRTGEIGKVYDRWLGPLGPPSALLSATYFVQGISE